MNPLEQFHIYSETRNYTEINDRNGIPINVKFDAIRSSDVFQCHQSKTPCNDVMLNPLVSIYQSMEITITRQQERLKSEVTLQD